MNVFLAAAIGGGIAVSILSLVMGVRALESIAHELKRMNDKNT